MARSLIDSMVGNHTIEASKIMAMRVLKFILLFSSVLGLHLACTTQKIIPKAGDMQSYIYRKVDDSLNLKVAVHYPTSFQKNQPLPAIIFFFGGGWKGGDRSHFLQQAKHYSEKGLIAIRADYRTLNKNGTDPFECVKDAKAAMRWVKQNAKFLGIDPNQIIAAGGSAGGHLAAATALIKLYNHPEDDLNIDPKPNALVLFNPVVDNGPNGYGFERIGEAYKQFSPFHNLQHGSPPTLFLLGTKDKLIPVKTGEDYCKQIVEKGGTCELKLYEGAGHGFFNYRNRDYFDQTLKEADVFLKKLGYLK